ncbi:MAG: hypothetical protein LBD02_04715 [Christensenellaceae bacterium]|jgi:hypothetical protein|nr:hypothetical protein [Christensenellaceae bacterium]
MWILIGAVLGLAAGLLLPVSLPKGAEGFLLVGILWLGGLLLEALAGRGMEEGRGMVLPLRAALEGALLGCLLWLGRRVGLALEQPAMAALFWRLLQGCRRLFWPRPGGKFAPPLKGPQS